MFLADNIIPFTIFFSPWLLLLIFLLGVVALSQRQRRAGKVTGLLAGLLLLLIITAYVLGDGSWHLLPALVKGYSYRPGTEVPDARLVPRRPDLIIERQLAALVGQTGLSPLHPDSPLIEYNIEAVHIDDWLEGQWLTAVLDTSLTFANNEQESVRLTLPAKGGSYILIPVLGEVNRNAYAWYAPESSLGHLLQTPAPATTLRHDRPPVTLQLAGSTDITSLAGVNRNSSFVVASDVRTADMLLLDGDLRQEETYTGNVMLRHTNGEIQTLINTWISARALFSPDGERIAYVSSRQNRPLQLIVRQADGTEQPVATVDWMTHHWVGNHHLAYSQDGLAYLHDLDSGESQPLASLPPHEFMGGQRFRVAPDGQHIAYADFDGRLWVKNLATNQQQPIGWDVTGFGWHTGLAWRDDGQQLLFATRDITTLPGQQALKLWDAASGTTSLIVRTGPGFLGSKESDPVNLGQACWLDDETVLFLAHILGYPNEVHLLTARTDGSGTWDITPTGSPLAFPEGLCTKDYVAINSSRTSITLFQVRTEN
jgi:hypothetical protein